MKALSIKQPWAWAIVNLPEPYKKKIENRTWKTNFRGEFYIHAGKGFDKGGYTLLKYYLEILGYKGELPEEKDFIRGALIGKATLVDCVQESDSVWYEDAYGFVLDEIEQIKPIPYKGALSFFKVEL